MIRRFFPLAVLTTIGAACGNLIDTTSRDDGADAAPPLVPADATAEASPIQGADAALPDGARSVEPDAALPDAASSLDGATPSPDATTPPPDATSPPQDGGGALDAGGTCPACPTRTCSTSGQCDLLVFVTPPSFTGLFGAPGDDTAAKMDRACTSIANQGGVSGNFVAWAGSHSLVTASYPWDRLGSSLRPYHRADGALVIDNSAALQMGQATLLAPINVLLNGTAITSAFEVWTGLTETGTSASTDCNEWESAGGLVFSAMGNAANTAHGSWTGDGTTASCATQNRLFCFQKDQ